MVKNDIEKMRKEFEEKIQIALLENELSEPLGDCYLRFIHLDKHSSDEPKKLFHLYKDDKVGEVVVADIKKCMEMYPATSGINVHIGNSKYIELPFYVRSLKSYGDKQGKLDISYIHNDIVVWMSLPIVGDLLDFFRVHKRNPVDSETSTYVSLVEARHKGLDIRIDNYNFKANQVGFYSGRNTLVDPVEINRIIEYIMK